MYNIENNDSYLLDLKTKLEENKIKISELTDNELNQLIKLYKFQLEQKKTKLIKYKKIIKRNS